MRDIVKARGLTLLFTEHDMSVVFGIAERISVLHHGEIIASGAPDAVRNDPGGEARLSRGARPWLSVGADLEVDGIHTAYGLSQVLFGVSLEVRARRVHRPDRPQRRRQDHDHARRSWA